MTLSIISNFAANSALRNLQVNSGEATKSVSKLSSGQRVTNAADDAASLAIGSRLNTEKVSLGMAVQNAGQATSVMQIADGTLSRVQDILTRMKALSVQSGSQNLSDTERAMLDTEYQNHLQEIDRLLLDTKFNSKELLNNDYALSDLSLQVHDTVVNGENATTAGTVAAPVVQSYQIEGTQSYQFQNLSVRGWDNRAITEGGNGQVSMQIQMGDPAAAASIGTAPSMDNKGIIDADGDGVPDYDVTFSLSFTDEGNNTSIKKVTLDRTLFYSSNPGGTNAAWLTSTGVTLSFRDGEFSQKAANLDEWTEDNFDVIVSMDANFVIGFNANATGLASIGNGGVATDVAAATAMGGSVGLLGAPMTLGSASEGVHGGFQDWTFKVGTGVLTDEDNIEMRMGAASAEIFGLTHSRIDTASMADAANLAISQALDALVAMRADMGGTMNRLEQSTKNIQVSMENVEAARSRMLDLDVAMEITNFTSKQILMQSGVSTLAQANQLPQNLLRLFA